MNVNERLAALRGRMQEKNIDIYVVPSADYHQSEYVGDYFKAREYISGFTGSAGTALISRTEARLWTDGRYFLQAEQELNSSEFELMKMGEEGYPTIEEYLDDSLKAGMTLGFDGRTISVEQGQTFAEIADKQDAHIQYDIDLIDEIWGNRPALSDKPVFTLGIEYAGESSASKLERIRKTMAEEGAEAHAVATIDDLCWILNIRGNDIEYFPLVLCYGIITGDSFELYIDESKLSDAIKNNLEKLGVNLHPYNAIYDDIKQLKAKSIMLDPDRFNFALYNDIPENCRKIERVNPSVFMKAIKNETEIANIRQAQIKDSIAHIKFMKWLKENVGKATITEISASNKLEEFRKEQGNYIGPSFDPISAFGEHGAIIHYTASPETNCELHEGSFLLTDTGAGYYEGSTDITRTYALGKVPDEFKRHFTLVVMGNLRLANARFYEGTTGLALDPLARTPMLDNGLNYNHGTGHGVGYLLNIHEDPIGFRYRDEKGKLAAFAEGHVVTDEPGIYVAGSHGIRLENELLCRKGEVIDGKQTMYFETITYIPFDLDAIDTSVMTDKDVEFLNAYHAKVYEVIAPYLNDDEREWLQKCRI